jgi:hypothetical protein
MEIRSPAVSSMSISRAGLFGDICSASNDQVVGGLAHGRDDHHHFVTVPAGLSDVFRHGRIRSAVPTDVPPYFCTMSDMHIKDSWGSRALWEAY